MNDPESGADSVQFRRCLHWLLAFCMLTLFTGLAVAGNDEEGGWRGAVSFTPGVGSWMAKFSGDIILTPDDTPAPGMNKTSIDVRVRKLAYLLLLQHKFASGWQAYMTLGGPTWKQEGFDYKLEEVSLVIGYTFSL